MNNNTNYANSRPRSVKRKKRTGFTMMEMMITLAIMAILFGLAVPAVAQIQKNLEMARLNSYAKDVYLAAQNRLTSLKATGELVRLREELEDKYTVTVDPDNDPLPCYLPNADGTGGFMPQDWDESWGDLYYNFFGLMHNPTDASDNDAIISEIIPELSVTSTTLDKHYYIEFNPYNGDVYAAFYTDAKSGFTAADIHNLPREDKDDNGRTKAYLRDDFVNTAGDNVMVGYYRGDPTEMLKEKEIKEFDVHCELVNKEDLYIKVTCDLSTYASRRKYMEASVTLEQVGTENSVVIPLNLLMDSTLYNYDRVTNHQMIGWNGNEFVYYILLDGLEQDGVTPEGNGVIDKLLAQEGVTVNNADEFKEAFEAGCNLRATANVELDFAGDVVRTSDQNSVSHDQNSRFGEITSGPEGQTVRVGYVRQLQNLDGYSAGGNAFNIEQTRVEYVKVIDEETGDYVKEVDKETGIVHYQEEYTAGPVDIYFNAKYEGEGRDFLPWDSDFLVGEPTGADLKNYLTSFTPINYTFGGNKQTTYNANGCGLYDFNIVGPASGNTGLFGSVKNMTFKEVSLIDAKVQGGSGASTSVGGLAGKAEDSQFIKCGVRLTDKTLAEEVRYDDRADIYGTMASRVDSLKVSATDAKYIGGLVGYAKNSVFDYSYAAVKVEDEGAENAGGLAGYLEGTKAGSAYTVNACYTSEPTIGGDYTGGLVGYMKGGSIVGQSDGNVAMYPSYATGDVTGSSINGIVGGFVGKTEGSVSFSDCNSFGRVSHGADVTTTNMGGFVGSVMPGASFTDCAYLQQDRYNKGTEFGTAQPAGITARAYTDPAWRALDSDGNEENSDTDSYPYTIYMRSLIFPFTMAAQSEYNLEGTFIGYSPIPHYGDWPLEDNLQTMLAYYEIYADGTVGFYGSTSMNGDPDEAANGWHTDSLLRGDVECVEDGYAILSSDTLTSLVMGGTTYTLSADFSKGGIRFDNDGSTRTETMHAYRLPSDLQGMSSAYESQMNGTGGTYLQQVVLTGKNGSEEIFTDYTFYYCPVLAKTAINPTPSQADDPSSCPSAAEKAKAEFGETEKPEAGIVRSARQLNAIGRMSWFWNMNFEQECHVNFGTYVKNYCGIAGFDLSGDGQTGTYRNKPIGNNTPSGKKPYTGTYNGNYNKIIDYCLKISSANDSLDAGLFGVLYKGTVENVVLMASDPNGNNGAGTAWVKNTMTSGTAYHMAPLVGWVDYDDEAFEATGGTARTIGKPWSVSSIKDSISNGVFAFDGETRGEGDSGKWSDAKDEKNGVIGLTPQNNKQYLLVTVKGNFGVVDSATLVTKKPVQYHDDEVYSTSSAASIKDGEVTFRLAPGDCYYEVTPASTNPANGEVTPEHSEYKLGSKVSVTLTGGNAAGWDYNVTSFTAQLFTTEPVVPTGDDPATYITGIANMSTVKNCAVAGYIVDYTPNGSSGNEVQIGGLVGKNQGEVYNCSASNKRLSASGSSGTRFIGGIAGVNKDAIIANCYSGGVLAAMGNQTAYVSGVVGQMQKGNETRDWCPAETKLISCYSFCSMENNDSSNIHYFGVANGSESLILHSHFYETIVKTYGAPENQDNPVFAKLEDKDRSYAATIRGETVNIPYALSYAQMKKLFKGTGFALSGNTGRADYDHSWPYDQMLEGDFPFPAVVTDNSGAFVHYGDWPAPNGTIYNLEFSPNGTFWVDFCVEAANQTDFNYNWGDWLKELKYQWEIGNFKKGDYIEIIVEPEFKFEDPEAWGLFQCCIHTMMNDTGADVEDAQNDTSYEDQPINFVNGQVYQFLFDVEEAVLHLNNDPQLWFAIDYNRKGGANGKLWSDVKDNHFEDDGTPAGDTNRFRLNTIKVNIYRDNSSTSTTDITSRKSTTTLGEGETTSVAEATHLELLKAWDFEPVNGTPATNILSTDKGPMVAGVISDTLYAGTASTGHSNMITLSNANDFRMNISDAFNNEAKLKKNECYQVEATFALGDGAAKDMSIRPCLVSGEDLFYASSYTLIQKRATSGANEGKVIWAKALYTFGEEGAIIDDNAYIKWIPRDGSNTLNGDLYVDNITVKKVAQGADPTATSATEATIPVDDDDAKLVAYWASDHATAIQAPHYEVRPADGYRYFSVGGKDVTGKVEWKEFLRQHESLTETQYMIVTLQYPEAYDTDSVSADNFTFTCDSYAYGENQTLSEVSAAVGEDAFDKETRTVKWMIGGPLNRSANVEYDTTLRTYFAYRNADVLINNNVLTGQELAKQFYITVSIYDRDPNATGMTVPTTTQSRTTKQLSGGTAVHTFAADTLVDKYMSFGVDDNKYVGYVDGNTSNTMSWNEFVNMVGALGDGQYLRVTLTNNNAPFGSLDLAAQTIQINAYRGVDGKIIKGEKAKSMNASTIVYQVNGPLDLNTVASDGSKEGYNDAGLVFTGTGDVGVDTSILVEIMSTATTAQLQGDNLDVLKDETISNKPVTITLSGDNFASSVRANDIITSWFSGLGDLGLSAKVASVSGNVLTANISGTVTVTPTADVPVGVTVPGEFTAKGGNDIVASGSFVISKKEPKASIIGDEMTRSFFVNEDAPQTYVDIKVANAEITTNLGSVADWYIGTLPTGLALSEVSRTNETTVHLVFTGHPTEQTDKHLTFKVPSFANTSGTQLDVPGDMTFSVITRPTVDVPTFSLAAGTYPGSRTVALSCETVDAEIEYKTIKDGVESAWTLYINPIVLTDGETQVIAHAKKEGCITSADVSNTYIITHDDNLLKNGYFEDGLDGWTFTPASANVQVVNGVLTVTDFHSSNALEVTASLKDGVTLKPDTTYRLSFIMNTNNENMMVKVVPGGNKSTEYTKSGTYEFKTVSDPNALSTFKIYISSPRNLVDGSGADLPVSGTFDTFVLTEVGGGSNPTITTESTTSQAESSIASQPESSAAESSTTSTVPGERTKVAQWVTTAGISHSEFKQNYGESYVRVYGNCPGMKDGTSSKTWREFLADIGSVSANQYFEIAFTHVDGESFHGAVNDGTKSFMSNTGYNPSTTTLVSADDLKVLFETNGALTYLGESDPHLEATLQGATGIPSNTDIICTVTLWEGSHGGETSEPSTSQSSSTPSESSQSETSQSETSQPSTYTNLIKNGNFADGMNGWTLNNGGTASVVNGVLTIPSQEFYPDLKISASLIDGYTIKPGIDYTLKFDMNSSNPESLYVKIRPGINDNGLVSCKESGKYHFTTTADVTSDKFEIWIQGAKSIAGLSATFDNFILVEGDGSNIPEGGDPNPPVTETYSVTVTGGNADKTSGVAQGETVTLTPPTTAPEQGKEFDKWQVVSGDITITNNTFVMPASDVEVKALYKWHEYSITVYGGNANGKSTAHYGETIQLNANTPETGKEFANWTVDSPSGLTIDGATATMTTFTMPESDVVIRANFTDKEYTITVNSNNATFGTAKVVGDVTKGTYATEYTLSYEPADGYRLASWTVSPSSVTVGENLKFLMPAENVTITAVFEKIVVPTHNVTVTGGTVNGGTGVATVAEGDTVTITASDPSTGYEFTGWTVTSPSGLSLVSTTASTTTFTMPKADVAITANFAKVNYNVTCGTVTGGTLTVNKTTANYGDTVTVTATPSTGYTTGTITMNGTPITGNTFTMPAANVTVSATFNKQSFAITVNNDSAKGTVTAPTTAAYGDTVTLSAVANAGWTFTGWTVNAGGVTVTNNQFQMPANAVTLTANYTADTSSPIASWSTTGGIGEVGYQNGVSTMKVKYNTPGTSGKTLEAFMNGLTLNANQYVKVTYTTASGTKFGNARRAATTFDMRAVSGGTRAVYTANDSTIVAYVVEPTAKTTDPSFDISWTNASAVPANTDVTVTVEVYNYTTSPIAGMDVTDASKAYTVTVVGGSASPASASPNTSVTVTPTVPSGQKFTGWTVDASDYLYVATVTPGSTANPLTFTMPYNNVKLTANFEEDETSDTPTTGDLIVNGNFAVTDSNASGFGWDITHLNTWSFSGNTATITCFNKQGTGLIQHVTGLTAGTEYKLTVTMATGDNIGVYNGSTKLGTASSGETKEFTFTASGTTADIELYSYNATYTVSNVSLVASGSTPATEPSQTTPTQSQPSGKYSLSSTLSLNKTADTTLVDNLVTPVQYSAGETATFQIVFQKVYQPTNKGDAGLRALVPIKANGADLAASSWEIGEAQGSNNFTVTFTYNVTMNANTVISGLLGEGYHGTVTVSSGGGSTPATDPTQATTKAKYDVTLGSVSGGTIEASQIKAEEGEQITLTATPNSGYTFGSWNVTGATVADASNASTTFTMPAGNVTVSATFNENTPAGGGNVLPASATLWQYSPGTNSTFTAGTGSDFTVTLSDKNGPTIDSVLLGDYLTGGQAYVLSGTITNNTDKAITFKLGGFYSRYDGETFTVEAGASLTLDKTVTAGSQDILGLYCKFGLTTSQYTTGTITVSGLSMTPAT